MLRCVCACADTALALGRGPERPVWSRLSEVLSVRFQTNSGAVREPIFSCRLAFWDALLLSAVVKSGHCRLPVRLSPSDRFRQQAFSAHRTATYWMFFVFRAIVRACVLKSPEISRPGKWHSFEPRVWNPTPVNVCRLTVSVISYYSTRYPKRLSRPPRSRSICFLICLPFISVELEDPFKINLFTALFFLLEKSESDWTPDWTCTCVHFETLV